MLVHVVLWHGALVGLYTCATDAAVASKTLHNSTVVTCHLNAETANGEVLLDQTRQSRRLKRKNMNVAQLMYDDMTNGEV